MLEKLFKYPAVLTRHRKAPLFEERDRYLEYLAKKGYAHETLLRIARELLHVAQEFQGTNIYPKSGVKPEQIKSLGNRWAKKQYRCGRAHTLKWSRQLFIQIATDWFRFMHRLNEPLNNIPAFMEWIKDFTNWMESDRGLSLITIKNYCWHIKKFFNWCGDNDRSISTIHISDVDTFLASCGNNGWSRVSVATGAKALKAFFRYAGQRGWYSSAIAHAIQGPRLFSQESLPYGPTWNDVNRMINYLTTDNSQDIRDRAIILLFSLYGFRSGEVSMLHLGNIDWENNLISVFRPKQRRTQIYPLMPIVGNAIVHYLKVVRPQTTYREIFLTLKAPIRPLSGGGLYNLVHRCMTNIELHTMHQGPHALRHACATHLMSKNFSLKEIGDHLGHSSTSATRIYAKVNLKQLRIVADVDLGGLL